MRIDFLKNHQTVNIFCDASMGYKKTRDKGCYGVEAVYDDHSIASEYRVITGTTNNNAEISAIAAGVNMALTLRATYPVINLFSDSQLCIFGLRDRIWKWYIDPRYGLMTKGGGPVKNQDIFMEIVYLILDNNLKINFFHQKGHVTSHIESLRQAEHVFRTSNFIRGDLDINVIRYISRWNNIVDIESRHQLQIASKYATPAIYFETDDFPRYEYRQLSRPYKDNSEPLY